MRVDARDASAAPRARGTGRRLRGVFALIAAAFLLMGNPPTALSSTPPAGAVVKIGAGEPLSSGSYAGNWATPDAVDYYTDSAGNLAIVTRDPASNTLSIDTLHRSTLARVGQPRTISLAGWPDWGGFYAAPDGDFYVLVGRGNPSEDDNLNVVAVRRYDRNWAPLGTAYLQGGATQGGVKGIYSPFDASAPHMVLVGNRLVVHMARLVYAIAGVHHQVNLTFEVNVDQMTATTFDALGEDAYSSHSFQELVAMNGSNLVTIDHGDAYPREIQMGVMAGYPDRRQVSTYDLFAFNGQTGDNFTGATVNALLSGPSGVVVLGTSIPQPNAPNGPLGASAESRNVYAISADPTTGAHAVRWLTAFAPSGADHALEPRAVQVGTDRYAVLFSVQHGSGYRMEYRLIDSAGAVLASASFPGVLFYAGSDPILTAHRVYWLGSDPSSHDDPEYLFALDVSHPTAPALVGWGRSGATQPAPRAPRLAAAISRRGRQVTVLVRTAAGARGRIRVSARQGSVRAGVHQHGRRYSFTARRRGRWSVIVSFTAARGWKSQTLVRIVSVPR